MPNWPRKLCRARPRASRFVERADRGEHCADAVLVEADAGVVDVQAAVGGDVGRLDVHTPRRVRHPPRCAR